MKARNSNTRHTWR